MCIGQIHGVMNRYIYPRGRSPIVFAYRSFPLLLRYRVPHVQGSLEPCFFYQQVFCQRAAHPQDSMAHRQPQAL